jgi:hypothetical protein
MTQRNTRRRSFARLKMSVARLVILLMASHLFWCSAAGPACASDAASTLANASPAVCPAGQGASPTCADIPAPQDHQHETCCGGIDETQTVTSTHKLSVEPVAVVVVDIAAVLPPQTLPLLLAENLYRRDGPEVRVLRSHLSRRLLLGRAPPASN